MTAKKIVKVVMRLSMPTFSFIVPVYNTAKYLNEALESLVNQDFDLDEIEIILINDASTDNSRDLCIEWQTRYPEVIHLIDKEQNEGVSAARNDGFAASHGRYINFFDSDDKWSNNCCSEVNEFFKAHRNIRLAVAKYHFFGSQKGSHPLYEHYTEDTIVDVATEPSFIHSSVNNCFIAREVVHDFDISIQVSENFRFINELLLTLGEYGILSKPIYWYRRRIDGSSVAQRALSKRSFYTVTPYKVYDYLCKLSKARTGGVAPYLQFAIAYDIFQRLKRRPWAGLTEADLASYKDILTTILQDIDDEIIAERVRDRIFKLYMFSLKYGVTFEQAQDMLFMPKHSGFVMFHAPKGNIEFSSIAAETRALLQS
ncbi:MAG: glycosyltransferase family 2 protein, partial [Eggerthellaceae bacterium]|nr:glycosyltransferase family 2 protein [Eggerthellaceae bacterium]